MLKVGLSGEGKSDIVITHKSCFCVHFVDVSVCTLLLFLCTFCCCFWVHFVLFVRCTFCHVTLNVRVTAPKSKFLLLKGETTGFSGIVATA